MKAYLNPSFPPEKYLEKIHEVSEISIGPVSWDDNCTRMYADFIQKCIDANAPLTSFILRDTTHVDALPGNLPKNQITKISISNCNQLVEVGKILQDFPNLESLFYKGKKIKLGGNLPGMAQLKILYLDANQVDKVSGISNFKSLESLSLVNLNIQELPSLVGFSELSTLTFKELKSLKKITVDFQQLPKLISLHLDAIGQSDGALELPASLFERSQLEILFLKNIYLSSLPEAIGQLKTLKQLTFYALNIKSLPDIFDQFSNLKKLEIHSCFQLAKLPDSIKRLPKLQTFALWYLDRLERIDLHDHQLLGLKSFSVFGMTNLKSIAFDTTACEELDYVGLYHSSALEKLSEDLFAAENIEKVTFNKLESLKRIPDSTANKPALRELTIDRCDRLEFIPKKIIPTKQHFTFAATNLNPAKFNEVEKSLNIDLNWKVEVEHKSFIIDWILHKEKPTSISKAEGDAILKAMAVGHKRISDELIRHVYGLNPAAQPISLTSIGEGGKVHISGRLTGGKDSVKGKLEELKLKLVTKLTDEVQFVLLGKKPKFTDELFNGKKIYFSQAELETLKKAVHPEMLQKKEISQAVVDNLNRLIGSKNEADILLAFEMVQQHGLPTKLEEGFLVAYHTMTKGKLRNKMKQFLKGKINDQKEHILESKTYPFAPHKVGALTHEEGARLYYILYQRTGDLRHEFFGVSPVDFPERQEMFTEILPKITKNPKRVNVTVLLTTDELDQLLSLPKFKGHLKEALIPYPISGGEIKGLELHKDSLKKLTLYFQKPCAQLPSCIYDAINLTELTLSLGNIAVIPPGISKLTSLKKLSIHSQRPEIEIPSDVIELKMLKNFYCYPVGSLDPFKSQMPWVF